VFHLVEAGSGGWLVGRGSRKTTLQVGSAAALVLFTAGGFQAHTSVCKLIAVQ
jgi:hypothetical protein